MEAQCDLGEDLVVPESLEKQFKQSREEEFCDWYNDIFLADYDFSKPASKAIVEFIVAKATKNIDYFGGKPIEEWEIVNIGNIEIGFCAYGWTGTIEDCQSINTIIYMEEK